MIAQFSRNGQLACHSKMIAVFFRGTVKFSGLCMRLPFSYIREMHMEDVYSTFNEN